MTLTRRQQTQGESCKLRPAVVLLGLLFLGVSIATAGCKKKLVLSSHNGFVLGPTSNITEVTSTTESQVSPLILNASVLIATTLADQSVKFCSGTFIGAEDQNGFGRVITNHHCFAVEDAQGLATPTLLGSACTATQVYFGFVQGRTDQSTSIPCLANSLRTTFDGDLAVFSLASRVPEQYQPLVVAAASVVPDGHVAAVVHYPDTAGELVTPSNGGAPLPVAQMTVNHCAVQGSFAVNEWNLEISLPYSIKHTCDILHGSSGSGLIDIATNQILGVNWGGITISSGGDQGTYNVAIKASFVQAFLANKTAQAVQTAEQTLDQEDSGSSKNSLLGPSSKSGCAVVLGSRNWVPNQSTGGFPKVLLWCLLAAPILMGLVKRRFFSLS